MKKIQNKNLIQLGDTVVSKAEEVLGRRQNFEYAGLWWHNEVKPALNQEGLRFKIVLTKDALDNELEATFQIAHEAVHLLSPATSEELTYFEEGIATFSIYPGRYWSISICENIKRTYDKTREEVSNCFTGS